VAEITNVVIGIQARSTSQRFPGKVFELIEGKPMLQWVIDACSSSARYLNKHGHKTRTQTRVVLLIPSGDPIGEMYAGKVPIFRGSENDVLSRYAQMSHVFDADYVVRITSDCPLIPPPLIQKHITTAIMNRYDYTSNVFEDHRTAPDGYDCEVISRALMEHMDTNAIDPGDREHVTMYARRKLPDGMKSGAVLGYMELSHLKLSVDTPEDLQLVRFHASEIARKLDIAEKAHGQNSSHRF
jgi:spore coat polysaccharide biosynthesis protein SpsF